MLLLLLAVDPQPADVIGPYGALVLALLVIGALLRDRSAKEKALRDAEERERALYDRIITGAQQSIALVERNTRVLERIEAKP